MQLEFMEGTPADRDISDERCLGLVGNGSWNKRSARERLSQEPVPRRLVSANFENASRIRAFGLRFYPALIARFRPAMVGCFLSIFFFADHSR